MTASLRVADVAAGRTLAYTGQLDAAGAGQVWSESLRAAGHGRDRKLVLDVSAVTLCDTSGASLLLSVERSHGGAAELRGATPQLAALLERVRAVRTTPAPEAPPVPWTYHKLFAAGLRAAAEGVAFLGEAVVATLSLPRRRRMVRFADILRTADQAGVRAMPLILLLGYLIGLILSFQSAIPLRRFGADIYVADLVSISLVRELGPLLAAVILAGRTGSAFAAEIGTMKVNEELDALTTMGLDPMTMLVLPRLGAAMVMMPALTLALDIAGLAGMVTVMRAFGYPFVAIMNQIPGFVRPLDLYGGLFKAVCFGAVVAAIGCRAGLATGVGPRAVGLSATAAVVGGIVATIALDGLFAVLFYRLGL